MPPPPIVGVVSLVAVPSATGLPASSVRPGAVALVSTVMSTVLLLALPFASVPSITSACSPSASGASGVKVQLPSAPAVVSPIMVSPSLMITVEPGCMPPPLRVGVLSLVLLPLATALPASSISVGVVPGTSLAPELLSLEEEPPPPEFDAAATPMIAARPPKTPPATYTSSANRGSEVADTSSYTLLAAS